MDVVIKPLDSWEKLGIPVYALLKSFKHFYLEETETVFHSGTTAQVTLNFSGKRH